MPVTVAVIMLVLGLWLRCLINYNFYFTIVGMGFIGISCTLILNCINTLCKDWFGPREWIVMNSLAGLVSFTGFGASFILPDFFIDPLEKDKDKSK